MLSKLSERLSMVLSRTYTERGYDCRLEFSVVICTGPFQQEQTLFEITTLRTMYQVERKVAKSQTGSQS